MLINFKYNLGILNQEILKIVLGVIFTPLAVLGFWYFMANKKIDFLIECVAIIGLYVILLCNIYIFFINLVVLLILTFYVFRYYDKKADFFKKILIFVFSFCLISIFWILKIGNNEVKAFSNQNIITQAVNLWKMPLAMIVFPFNIFGLACLLRKEKLKQNIIVMIFSSFYIFISFISYIYMPLFNNFVVLLNKLGLILWIKILFGLFSIMGILRFNRLINRQHSRRLSIFVLILILPLLFFNFEYLKAFYVDVMKNSSELVNKIKKVDNISLEDKKSEIKVAFEDKKKEIKKNVLRSDLGNNQINEFILNNSISEEELVYNSDEFFVLVDDNLFLSDLDSGHKSEKILEEIKIPIILLRSKEVLEAEDIGFDYVIIGDVNGENIDKINEKYSGKLIDLKNINNLKGEYSNFDKLDYVLVNDNIQIKGAEKDVPIILNYKYDKNWRAYQDGKMLEKYFVLPDKMMFLPKSESNIKIKKNNDIWKLWILIGIVGLFAFGLIVWKIKKR